LLQACLWCRLSVLRLTQPNALTHVHPYTPVHSFMR
jgi:hypothetical protein